MELLWQVVVSGLAAGGIYGLVAISLVLVYRLTGIVYFAFGDLVGFAVFAALLVAAGTGPVTQTNVSGARYALALAVGVLVCVVVGAGGYLLVIQPFLERNSTLGWVGANLALAFAIHAAIESVFPRSAYVFPDPIPFRRIGEGGFVVVGGATLQLRALYVAAVAFGLALLVGLAIDRTRSGRGLRAIAEDRMGSAVFYGPPGLLPLAFGLAGAVAAVAAVAAAPSAPVSVETGTLLGVKGLAAALIVRFGPPLWAFAAGAALGLLEAAIANVHVAGFELGPEYSQVLPLLLVLVALALRPPREALEEVE